VRVADDAPPLLPELARSLRVLGTPRDAAAEAAHAAVFAPLLGARARASRGNVSGALAALRGQELMARIESLARSAAETGGSDAARARARVAETAEILDPLRAAFAELDRLGAEVAQDAPATSPEWERWVAQLRRVFAAADLACGNLATLLASAEAAAPARRWFGGGGGERSR
jgi:hypothetical protein